MAFHPSDEQLVSGGFDRHVREWSVPSLQPVKAWFDNPMETVYGVRYSSDGGRFLISCMSPGNRHRVWDCASGAKGALLPSLEAIEQGSEGWEDLAAIFAGFTNRFREGLPGNRIYAVTNDGQRLIVGHPDEQIHWRLEVRRANGEKAFDFEVGDNVQALAISNEDRWIACAGPMGRVFIWRFDTDADEVTAHSPWHDEPQESPTTIEAPLVRINESPEILSISPDGATVAARAKKTIVFLNMYDGKEISAMTDFLHCAYRDDGKFVGVGPLVNENSPRKRQIEIHDPTRAPNENTLISTISTELDPDVPTNISPDGRFVAILDEANQDIVVFDTHERRAPVRHRLLDNDASRCFAVASVPVANDDQIEGRNPWRMAWSHWTMSAWNEVQVYLTNLSTGVTKKALEPPNAPPVSLQFSPDGMYVVGLTGTDARVWVWNAETGESRHLLVVHSASVAAVGFAPDSKVLLTGGLDAKVCVWDLETGTLMRTLETAGLVLGVVMGVEGRIAASTTVHSSEGFIWIAPDKLLDMARALIPRDPPDYLTFAEMKRFGL